MARYQYALSTLDTGLQYLFDLDITPPHQVNQKYSKYVSLGDGGVRGLGFPVTEWYWAFLSQAEIDALRVYCAGASADVKVRTPNEDNTWTTYIAKMIWPEEAVEIQNGYYMKFSLQFRLIEVDT